MRKKVDVYQSPDMKEIELLSQALIAESFTEGEGTWGTKSVFDRDVNSEYYE